MGYEKNCCIFCKRLAAMLSERDSKICWICCQSFALLKTSIISIRGLDRFQLLQCYFTNFLWLCSYHHPWSNEQHWSAEPSAQVQNLITFPTLSNRLALRSLSFVTITLPQTVRLSMFHCVLRLSNSSTLCFPFLRCEEKESTELTLGNWRSNSIFRLSDPAFVFVVP